MSESPKRPIICAYRRDGLGARLNALTNAARISSLLERPLRIIWPARLVTAEQLYDPQPATDLFSEEFVKCATLSQDDPVLGASRDIVECLEISDQASLLQNVESQSCLTVTNAFRIHQFAWETAEDAKAGYQTAFQNLPWSDTAKQVTHQIDKVFSDQPFIAVHLRRGDIINPLSKTAQVPYRNKYVPIQILNAMVDWVRKKQKDHKILVFSESNFAIQKFAELQPDAVGVSEFLSLDREPPLIRDFAELYALSKVRTIIGASRSAYLIFAAQIGNGSHLHFSQQIPITVQDKAQKDLFEELEAGPAGFENLFDYSQSLAACLNKSPKFSFDETCKLLETAAESKILPVFIWEKIAAARYKRKQYQGVIDCHLATKRDFGIGLAKPSKIDALAGLSYLQLDKFHDAAKCHELCFWQTPQTPRSRKLAQKVYWNVPMESEDGFYKATGFLDPNNLQKGKIIGDIDLLLWPDFRRFYRTQKLELDPSFRWESVNFKDKFFSPSIAKLLEASFEFARGNRPSAFNLLTEIEAEALTAGPLVSLLGYLTWESGNKNVALDHMFRAVELEYSGPKSISRLAEKLGKRKMNEGAASLFAELYQQDHGVVEARISGIEFWLWRGEFHHAAQELSRLEEQIGKLPIVAQLRYILHSQTDEKKDAQNLLALYKERYVDISKYRLRYG